MVGNFYAARLAFGLHRAQAGCPHADRASLPDRSDHALGVQF